MPAGSVHPVLRFLRTLTASGGAGDAPDAQLLERFVAQRDEAAFAALVRRHGPMVFGVCARVLGPTPDAEDAFQATFLVLVRRAGALGQPERLANWLYGVAYRTAQKARTDFARRRRHESQVARTPLIDPTEEVEWRDLRPVLDEELNRLPAKYRVPLVLCHLEGQTHEEVARQLGCPRETITTRLTRARERLRRQLVRRGVALSAGALVAGAAVPAALAEGTVQAALGCAAGLATARGVLSARVAALTEGVVRAMWLNQMKVAAAVLLAVGVLAGGVAALAPRTTAAEQPEPVPAVAAEPEVEQPTARREQQREVSVKSSAPVVVRTVPQAGDTQVDAATTKEIRVTFSKEMADQSWSWTQISKDTYPKTTGKPSYDKDRRTCVLPVQLEPGKTYVVWLNPEKFKGFRDTDGRPAAFYPLVFETKP